MSARSRSRRPAIRKRRRSDPSGPPRRRSPAPDAIARPQRSRLTLLHFTAEFLFASSRPGGTDMKAGEPEAHARCDPGGRIAEEADLLAVGERSSLVADRHLDGDETQAHELAHELPVEVETIRRQQHAVEAFRPEHLVHGERVSKS